MSENSESHSVPSNVYLVYYAILAMAVKILWSVMWMKFCHVIMIIPSARSAKHLAKSILIPLLLN